MDSYPQHLVNQYLKASNKLKKFDRIVFKRFAPNVSEVLDEFARLALKFEEAAIHQYAAMCYLGVAKCEMSTGNTISECNAYLKAARAFLRAYNITEDLGSRSNCGEYKEGSLRCYNHALERSADDAVLKAAIIREMTPLQPYFEGTSSFSSATHVIYELESAACVHLLRCDFLSVLQQLDDIVDNIYERKQQDLYEELLKRVEVMRLLLLVVLNLPPARQSPSHIKLIEYYFKLANFGLNLEDNCINVGTNNVCDINGPGSYLPLQTKYVLAEIVFSWCERRQSDLKLALQELLTEFPSLDDNHIFLIKHICMNIEHIFIT